MNKRIEKKLRKRWGASDWEDGEPDSYNSILRMFPWVGTMRFTSYE